MEEYFEYKIMNKHDYMHECAQRILIGLRHTKSTLDRQ